MPGLQDLKAAGTPVKRPGSPSLTCSAGLWRLPSSAACLPSPGGHLNPSVRCRPSSSGRSGLSPPSASDRLPSYLASCLAGIDLLLHLLLDLITLGFDSLLRFLLGLLAFGLHLLLDLLLFGLDLLLRFLLGLV